MLRQSVTLGHLAGIPIRLHWSWAIIVGLMVANFAPIYDGALCGGAGCAAAWALAAAMAAVVSASVLIHELGHALVARRWGVPVAGISLFAFGGMAEARGDAPTPGAELAIALAGPLANLALAAPAAGAWWALGEVAPGPALVCGHLAIVNAGLAIFNLLPGYPMDGGRILRAALWYLGDEVLPATRLVARLGRGLGLLLVCGGLVVGVGAGNALLALWLVVIGFFLTSTARSNYRQLLVHTALHGVRVGDLMQRRFQAAAADLSVEQFVSRYILGQAELGFAVVSPAPFPEDEPELLGMLTLRHIRRLKGAELRRVRLDEVMTPAEAVGPLQPQTPAIDALYHMNATKVDLLPVTEGGRLVGMLRRRDLAVFIAGQTGRRPAGPG